MIFVDELKEAWGMVRNPGANTKKERSIKDSILFFYKSTFLLLVVGVILLIVAGNTFASSLGALGSASMLGSLAGGVGAVLLAVGAVIEWLLLPIFGIVGAAILQFFGKSIFKVFTKGLQNTYAASIYGIVVEIVLYFIVAVISTILFLISPILGVIGTLLLVIVAIWGFVATILALANQQGITWAKALLVELATAIIIVVIVLVLLFLIGGAALL